MRKPGEPLPVETLPRKELEKLQNRRLRYTVRMANYTTKFWHELFKSVGIKAEDIRNRDDLYKAYRKEVKLTKEDLIFHYKSLLPSYIKNREASFLELQTSGFGGTPKKIPWTIPPISSNEVVTLAYNSARVSENSRFLNALSPYPYSSGILSTFALTSCFPKTYFKPRWNIKTTKPLSLEEMKNLMNELNPTHIMTLPSKIADLTYNLREGGQDPQSLNVEVILLGGDAITKAGIEKVQENWNAEVFDILGSSECSLYGYECEEHSGLHVAENRVLFSVGDPETHEIMSEKEEGVDLVTTLYDEGEKPGIFLINYSHGDLTKILTTEKCPCGRSFMKIDYPIRYDEIISIRGVKLNPLDIERVKAIKDYICVEEYDEDLLTNTVEVRVFPEVGYDMNETTSLILKALYSSNPKAPQLLKEGDILIHILSSPQELYRGLKIPPGKKRRVIRKIKKK